MYCFSQLHVDWVAWLQLVLAGALGWLDVPASSLGKQLTLASSWSSATAGTWASGLSVATRASSQHGDWVPPEAGARRQKWRLQISYDPTSEVAHSLLPHSVGQNRSRGQPALKGRGNRLDILMGGVTKNLLPSLIPYAPLHSVTHLYYTVFLRLAPASVSVPASVSELRNWQHTQVFHLVHNVLL